jgi:hypothetical protein
MSFHLTQVTLEYHRVCPKWFPYPWFIRRKPCTNLVSRLLRSPNGPKRVPLDQCHQEVPSGVPEKISVSWYIRHKTYTDLAPRLMLSPNGPKWASTRPTSPRSTNRHAQNDFHAVVHLARTMHLSCVEINAISKRTEASFHLSHITNECHRVCPKWFPYLWDVLSKPCNYLASRLTLSPNGPRQASTWHTLPRSTIGCAQSDFHASGTFIAKPCTYLALDSNYLQNKLKWAFAWPTSPRSTIGCIQNDFQAYGTFGANHAPILCRD